MGTQRTAIAIALVTLAAASPACIDRPTAPVCPVPTELKSDAMQGGGFDGVDMLFVVDNSSSMDEEQTILATGFYTLVNALANPLPSWEFAAVDSIRVGVATSNMGLSSDGQSNDQYWPGGDAPAGCHDFGDDGAFQEVTAPSVEVQNDAIGCTADAAQCPSGWSCAAIDPATGVGVCHTDGATAVACSQLGAPWAETAAGAANPELVDDAACLARQGIDGCGFEQQLTAAATALGRPDQEAFLAPEHLLAVVVVSDEEDCSMEDGPGLLATDEVQDLAAGKVNIACGEHPEFLWDTHHFYEELVAAKGGPNAVIFAAIVGVPYGAQPGAHACQGLGSTLGGCLAQEEMQLVPVPADNGWFYSPACERGAVTSAIPGRRYVELAHEDFGDMAYVYSICNPDWSPAMEEIASLIGAKLEEPCYDKPLAWDPVAKVATCNVVVAFDDPEVEECPPEFGDPAPEIVRERTPEGEEVVHLFCRVPKLPSERDCAAQTPEQAGAIADGFGWYYCESPEAGDAGADGCRYTVQLTDAARRATFGRAASVQCLQQFSFTDRNCQEDSRAACTDGADNDGNGVWDCADELDGDWGHLADPSCCPIAVGEGGICDLAPAGAAATWEEICPADAVGYAGGYPDACREAASRLGCALP